MYVHVSIHTIYMYIYIYVTVLHVYSMYIWYLQNYVNNNVDFKKGINILCIIGRPMGQAQEAWVPHFKVLKMP